MGSEEELVKVKARLDAGEEFSALAKECSKCSYIHFYISMGEWLVGNSLV